MQEIYALKWFIFTSKCTKMRLAAGLRPGKCYAPRGLPAAFKGHRIGAPVRLRGKERRKGG